MHFIRPFELAHIDENNMGGIDVETWPLIFFFHSQKSLLHGLSRMWFASASKLRRSFHVEHH